MSKHLLHLLFLYIIIIYIVIALLKDECDIFYDDPYRIPRMAQHSKDLVTVISELFYLKIGQN